MSNKTQFDCIVVGAGFSGGVIARKLAEDGKKVFVLERRGHIAGNMYDEKDTSGILVQRYGPHIFHTNEKEVIDFVTKYGKWTDYHHKPMVEIDGVVTPAPINFRTIDLLYDINQAKTLKLSLSGRYKGLKSVTILELLECEDIVIRRYAEKLFDLNYRPYTVKQWGVPPEEIDTSILKRVPVRLDYTEGYFDDEFQALPEKGYTRFFTNLLDHENIKVQLNTDALSLIKIDISGKQLFFDGKPVSIPVVYTGSVDELLDYCYGQLAYRSLVFDFHTKSVDSFQETAVVAHPEASGYTRITEYKKIPPQNVPGVTTVVYEYPTSADKANKKEQYYPILTGNNVLLYNRYRLELSGVANLFLSGRLADYKYYNMDAAILRALQVYQSINRA